MLASLIVVLTMGMLPLDGGVAPWNAILSGVEVAPPVSTIEISRPLSASGVLVMDLRGGQTVFSKNAGQQRPMGSLTKLMTALLIVENHSLKEFVTVPAAAEQVQGMRAYLPAGEQFTVGDLLSALLIASANDAAMTLAQYHSGSTSAFVEEMNTRTQALGLRSTSFADPIGFDHPGQWSTPRDIAWLTTFMQRFPAVRERMSKRGTRIYSRSSLPLDLVHTHALLHADTNVVAGKTGTTSGANECLVSIVDEGGTKYLVVLLNSLERYRDMQTVLDALSPQSDLVRPVTARK